MPKICGIHFGTTYSAIATLDDLGIPVVVENYFEATPALASAVYFPQGGNYPVVGEEAKNQSEIEPDRVVQFIKRELERSDAEVRNFDGVEYEPVCIAALIFKQMKNYAEEQGIDIMDAAVACPAWYGVEEKSAIRNAALIAGFNTVNIVCEPIAAAISCIKEPAKSSNKKVLVFDLGGASLDLTLLDVQTVPDCKPEIKIITLYANSRLGGIEFDARLYDYICELYEDENGISQDEMDAELRQKIRAKAANVKKALSCMIAKKFVISYAGDVTLIEVTRENFEERTRDLVVQTITSVNRLLEENGFLSNDIDEVILVGGSTKMPMIISAVKTVFPGKVNYGQPDLAIAKGAVLLGLSDEEYAQYQKAIKQLIVTESKPQEVTNG